MKRPQPEIDITVELRVHIARKYKTQAAAAKQWGCSSAFVSGVLRGNKVPNEKMLADAGFKKLPAAARYVKV